MDEEDKKLQNWAGDVQSLFDVHLPSLLLLFELLFELLSLDVIADTTDVVGDTTATLVVGGVGAAIILVVVNDNVGLASSCCCCCDC